LLSFFAPFFPVGTIITAFASDRRLQRNIKSLERALDKVNMINGVTFDWVADAAEKGFVPPSVSDAGVLAQEIQAVLPEAVKPAPFDTERDPATGELKEQVGHELPDGAVREARASVHRVHQGADRGKQCAES
jgi:hypothetical protein